VVQHTHIQGGVRLLRDALADAAEADDAEGVAGRVVRDGCDIAVGVGEGGGVEGARGDGGPGEEAEGGEEEPEGGVGDGVGAGGGGVAVEDAWLVGVSVGMWKGIVPLR